MAVGPDPGWRPIPPDASGSIETPDGDRWLEEVPLTAGFWLEVAAGDGGPVAEPATALADVVGAFLASEHAVVRVSEELAGRYEEIDLLYTISEILGRTMRLKDAANTILRELSTVVMARRASIMVHDETLGTLRPVASRGFSVEALHPVAVDDPDSVAAKVFRDERLLAFDPNGSGPAVPAHPERDYRGRAFLCVPISYAAPGGKARCVGVMNFTDRLGDDLFSDSDRKLVAAVANQVGAAVENARLVIRDLKRQRIQRELELAHDLQLKLMPEPSVLHGDATVAVRCLPAESVGGDFYTFRRLGTGSVGVMLGDVSSHGFSAALVMALVLAAAGIHTGDSGTPDQTLRALHESLSGRLDSTEMYLTVFYGVLDPAARVLRYANAGHQHAFQFPAEGPPRRLDSTAPPLGLGPAEGGTLDCVAWDPTDLLCLWTDGLVEARSQEGESFGETRLLEVIGRHRRESPDVLLDRVFAEVDAFSPRAHDDRTLLILRL